MFSQHDVGGQGGDLTTLFQPVSVTGTTVRGFWELLQYFTVAEKFARFAHARHHSDELEFGGGGVDHRLPHPWLRRVSVHQQEKKT